VLPSRLFDSGHYPANSQERSPGQFTGTVSPSLGAHSHSHSYLSDWPGVSFGDFGGATDPELRADNERMAPFMFMFDPLADQIRRCRDAQSLAECVLHHGLKLTGACLGNVQLMNWTENSLEIKAQSGFGDEFLNFFNQVGLADLSACARALRKRDSVVVEDVNTDQAFAPCCEILRRADVRAVQSTPLLSSSGALVGILSTHFSTPHRPTDIEMRNLRHAANVAANALISVRVNGGSSSDAINASLKLLQQSQETLERAERLLSVDHFC
jgi:GAF domain-containing protein